MKALWVTSYEDDSSSGYGKVEFNVLINTSQIVYLRKISNYRYLLVLTAGSFNINNSHADQIKDSLIF